MKRPPKDAEPIEHPPGTDHGKRKRRIIDYDPAEFFVPSADQQGHNDQYRFRAPKGYNRRMAEILASHKFPFVTSTDILRYALHIGLRRLDHMEPSSTVQQQLEMIRVLMSEAQFQQDFMDLYAEAERVINRYIQQEDRASARNLVARALAHIRKMPDETNWRAKYEKQLLEKYGWLLKEGRGRKLAALIPNDKNKDGGQ